MGAIFMSENNSSGVRTRHIDTCYPFVCELVDDKIIEIVFVKTSKNLADGFRKNTSGDVYDAHTGNYVVAKEDIAVIAFDLGDTAVKGVLKSLAIPTAAVSMESWDKDERYERYHILWDCSTGDLLSEYPESAKICEGNEIIYFEKRVVSLKTASEDQARK